VRRPELGHNVGVLALKRESIDSTVDSYFLESAKQDLLISAVVKLDLPTWRT
jgi:hypothetical protein